MKRKNDDIVFEQRKQRAFFEHGENMNNLLKQYHNIVFSNKMNLDIWGYVENQKVIHEQIDTFVNLNHREKLILFLYKKDGDGYINALARQDFRQINYYQQNPTRLVFYKSLHPLFPVLVDERFDKEKVDNGNELLELAEIYQKKDDLIEKLTLLTPEKFRDLISLLTNKLYEIVQKFPVLEGHLMVFRGDQRELTRANPRRFTGILSSSLSSSIAKNFTDYRCCYWKILLLPGTQVVFLDVILRYYNFSCPPELEVLLFTSSKQSFVFLAKEQLYHNVLLSLDDKGSQKMAETGTINRLDKIYDIQESYKLNLMKQSLDDLKHYYSLNKLEYKFKDFYNFNNKLRNSYFHTTYNDYNQVERFFKYSIDIIYALSIYTLKNDYRLYEILVEFLNRVSTENNDLFIQSVNKLLNTLQFTFSMTDFIPYVNPTV